MIEHGHDKKNTQIGNILEKFLLQQISAILRDNSLGVTQKTHKNRAENPAAHGP